MLRNEVVDVGVLMVDVMRKIFTDERVVIVIDGISRTFLWERDNVVVSEDGVWFHGGYFLTEEIGYERVVRRRLRRNEIFRHGGCAGKW